MKKPLFALFLALLMVEVGEDIQVRKMPPVRVEEKVFLLRGSCALFGTILFPIPLMFT